MAGRRLIPALLLVALAAACTSGGDERSAPGPGPAETTSTTVRPQRGGVARVAVWQEPDPDAASITGAGVRSLVLPQLFRAGPDGEWEPWLVQPGSVEEASDHRTVSFRLREGARWSDGSPITAADLRRGADRGVLESVETADGATITARFLRPLPGWRSLWSGANAVVPPSSGTWGGPFVLARHERGLRAVLEPNPHWWGDGPYLDRLELVVVPDDATARQLLGRGEIDVVSPRAGTARTPRLRALDGVRTDTSEGTGWWFGARTEPSRIGPAERLALLSLIDGPTFARTLLDGEASPMEGFATTLWRERPPGDPAALDGRYDVVFAADDPVAGLIHRAMAARAPEGVRVEGRSAGADSVTAFSRDRDYDVLLDWFVDDPEPCWRCRHGAEAPDLALDADTGDDGAVLALQRHLRDSGLLLPLWRPVPVVASRDGLVGPEPNGWARIAAWNAESWHRPDG